MQAYKLSVINMKKLISAFMALLIFSITIVTMLGATEPKKSGFIKYVEFNVTKEALLQAIDYDIQSYKEDIHIDFIICLSYLGAKYGGDFKRYKASDMSNLVEKLKSGESIDSITKNMKYYSYYKEAYTAALNGMIGNYEKEIPDKNGNITTQKDYGLCWFSPIAKTFPYSSFDDFGTLRTYGYSRPHLGHDMMSAVGTPVIAVESGVVECMGWNQYGGWRIGIRSNDKQRYWYYAHLRQNRPFAENLKEGDIVTAGDVIGYVGRTGYSSTENTNGITESHLHIGLELIFDESQKECDNEIWISLTAITDVLEKNKSAVLRNSKTKEFTREYKFSILE